MDIEDSGVSYAADANYIIFRDIDLAGAAWKPLMFSGTMLGVKAGATTRLSDCIKADGTGVTDVKTVANPVISNVSVIQSGPKLDVRDYTGIGFFATISNKMNDKKPFERPQQARVSNITLDRVTVENKASAVHVDETLISALLDGLGAVVGKLLAGLLYALTLGKVNLFGLIENLLNIRAADPSALATGAFAGRVIGDVDLSGCEARRVSVSTVAKMSGGFVGYSQGETHYELLSKALDDIVTILTNILNIIPGVGLGDLITLLLDSNIIKAGELLPVELHQSGYLQTAPLGTSLKARRLARRDKTMLVDLLGHL
ncbi:MAG: hypothetical protein ACLTSX_03755 [Collinsella sp.]